ncbi:MAG: VOC family protein [Proteobacteria bacterium]|nr:VOC family protein [Pseudomonadota bacterium]
MQIDSYYPVLCSEIPRETQDFYVKYLDFEPVFESEWYVHLTAKESNGVNLAIVNSSHSSIPEGSRRPVQGLLLNFEVADVDAEYDRLRHAGLPMELELRDEPWGQRHFIIRDPNGILIDMIKVIPPSKEFLADYVDGA